LDKLKINKDIRHKHGKEIYVIEKFVINILWKRIISYLWIYTGATLDVLWKGNIAFLWVLTNDFVFAILVDHDTCWIGKIWYQGYHTNWTRREGTYSCLIT
jgi:hypothetical protein